MADELRLEIDIRFSDDGIGLTRLTGPLDYDVTKKVYAHFIQAVGTSEEALNLGDIGTGGYCFLKNLDATNFVKVRPGTGAADLIKLLPGDVALFRLVAAAPFAISDTASCNVEVALIGA
jgi:hypothetical protein